jgi:polyisoprenoid-binding protein YceI
MSAIVCFVASAMMALDEDPTTLRRELPTMATSTSTGTVTQLESGTWNLDASHSAVGFTVRHLMVSKVRGKFTDFTANVVVADDRGDSTVEAVVQMASIDTGDANRDNHLRTNDFFSVEDFPTMTLRSTGFEITGDDELVMHADLTIRGVTKPVDFAVEFGGVGPDPWGGTRAGFNASATISRKDFGIEWNAPLETGGVVVADKVNIELDVELVKAS